MDYDRALYRVYERAIEDLSATPFGEAQEGQAPFIPFCSTILEVHLPNRLRQISSYRYRHLETAESTESQAQVVSATDRFRQRALARMHAMRTAAHVEETPTPQPNQEEVVEDQPDVEQGNVEPTETAANTTTLQTSETENQSVTYDSNTTPVPPRGSLGSNVNTNPFAQSANGDNEDSSSESNGCSQKGLYLVMQISLWAGIYNLVMLYIMHSTYVRPDLDGGIIGLWNPALTIQNEYHKLSLKMPPPPLGYTLVDNSTTSVDFYRGPTCLEYALSSRPPEFEWNATNTVTTNSTLESDYDNIGSTLTNNGNNNSNKSALSITTYNNTTNSTGNWTVLPLLREDEILYIKIIYNAQNQCGDQGLGQCSRTHLCNNTDPITTDEFGIDHNTSDWSNTDFWTTPTYKFSTMEALMYTPDNFLWQHNVSIVNVTLTERCLSSGSDWIQGVDHKTRIAELMTQVYGVMDTVIINQVMYGIRNVDGTYRSGFLQNMETLERWSWSRDFLLMSDSRNPAYRAAVWWVNKIFGTLFVSLLGFFLTTSVTALIVRILTSSGVVLMFPMFSLFRFMGLPGADDRLLGLSYPWIGRARSAIRQRHSFPDSHLIWAHVCKIILFYVMYEACQGAWSMVLYGKSIPAGLPVWIYGFAMIWEYFSMVFVRSALR